MSIRRFVVPIGLAALSVGAAWASAREDGRGSSGPNPKKVLVELYTSQGCDSCPSASALSGRLAKLGYGPDKVVLVNFHVDYFNKPWADPFSDERFSRRQIEYNGVQKRDDLYFTPLMMVDGRHAMLGSNKSKALEALGRSSKGPAGARLAVDLKGTGDRRAATVTVSEPTAAVAGRELLVAAAVTEGPVTTKVRSGENAGKSLVEYEVVRSFTHQMIRLDGGGSKSVSFDLRLGEGQAAGRSRVAVFVQDKENGEILQTESVPWQKAVEKSAPLKEASR